MRAQRFTTVMAVVDEYVEMVTIALARWSHRKGHHYTKFGIVGGHAPRTIYRAKVDAEKRLRKLGYTDQSQINQIMRDAQDLVDLERNAE